MQRDGTLRCLIVLLIILWRFGRGPLQVVPQVLNILRQGKYKKEKKVVQVCSPSSQLVLTQQVFTARFSAQTSESWFFWWNGRLQCSKSMQTQLKRTNILQYMLAYFLADIYFSQIFLHFQTQAPWKCTVGWHLVSTPPHLQLLYCLIQETHWPYPSKAGPA